MISFLHIDKALTFQLDSDADIGDNVNIAQAAGVSLNKNIVAVKMALVGIGKTRISGLCTDAGRGGTRDGLALEMSKLCRKIDLL